MCKDRDEQEIYDTNRDNGLTFEIAEVAIENGLGRADEATQI